MDSQIGLFETQSQHQAPLAARLRPVSIDNYEGQEHIRPYLKSFEQNPSHIVFWGPAGCGKTTIAKILAGKINAELYEFNAVLGGVNDLRKIIATAIENQQMSGKRAIIFIDEIHRFNKSQQDALLPYLENADFILFGATTEYPQTSLNKAILSRIKVLELKKLGEKDIESILKKANSTLDEESIDTIARYSNGDARYALNQLEYLMDNPPATKEELLTYITQNARSYDKNSNRHYDVISAFIKSIRGSDVDAAILWLAVMLDGGEDPVFIARRLVIAASEDIGNANPDALTIATSALIAVQNIGMPEARISLAQTTTFLASSPKSNASYKAVDAALAYVRSNPTIDVPTHLCNLHPDKKNYKYPHAYSNHYVDQEYMPIKEKFFESSGLGYEKKFDEYLNTIKGK